MTGASGDGFQTTVFPQSSAGITFQEGTAIGKFEVVISAATPRGRRGR